VVKSKRCCLREMSYSDICPVCKALGTFRGVGIKQSDILKNVKIDTF